MSKVVDTVLVYGTERTGILVVEAKVAEMAEDMLNATVRRIEA